jgi:hypothetical protein
MAVLPWRFQCDLSIDDQGAEPFTTSPDPEVTVFVAETYTSDSTQKKIIHRETSYPINVKASQLAEFLTASVKGIDLDKYPRMEPVGIDQPQTEKDKK